MRDERNDLAQQEMSLPKLPGRGYGKREKKGPGAGKIVAAVLAAALVLAAVIGIGGRMNGRSVAVLQASAVESAVVRKGSISTTVSGTGTLAANDTEEVDLLSLVSVDTVYVEAGDRVKKGQRLASVDPLSVRQALAKVQEELDQVDSDLEEVQDDKVDAVIESNVSGRVKKIYGKKGDSVAAVMQEQGALMLLSLDGKMAATVETDRDVEVGDTVQVTLSDSDKEIKGTVATVGDRTVTVTVTDDGTAYGSEVQVYDGDAWLGAGTLQINSELKITGYAGTIDTVKVSENQKVKDGTDLYKLTDLPHTAEYERLVAERAELADTLQELIGLYADGNIYAGKDGTIQSVNCGDAKTVKDSAVTAREEEDDGASAGNDAAQDASENGTAGDDGAAAGNDAANSKGTVSANPTGTGGTSGQAGVKSMVYATPALAGGDMTAAGGSQDGRTAKVMTVSGASGSGTAKTGNASGGTENGSDGGNPSGQAVPDTGNEGSGADGQGSNRADQSTGTGSEPQSPDESSGAGNASDTGNEGGPSPDPGGTGSGSSSDGSVIPDDGSSAGTGDDGTERLAITSLSAITIADPAAGEKVQQELVIAGDAGYSGTLAWSPGADKTYEADTAYTAEVELKAREGYYFDMDRIQAGKTVVSNGSGGKTALTEIKKAEADGSGLTFAVVYPKTGDGAAAPEGDASGGAGNGQTGRQAADSFSWSGGTGGVSASAYSARAASDTDTDVSEDAAGDAESGDTARTVIFTQSADEKMAVTVSVDELDILSLQEGQTAEVTLDAIENEVFEGTVTEIHTLSDTSGNGVTKYSAIVEITKTERMLAGMNASVTVTVSESAGCLLIPEEALNEEGRRVTVYTAYDESTGELSGEREVSTGVSNGTSVEITEGLAEGDTIYYQVSTENVSGTDMPFMMAAPADMPNDGGWEEKRGGHGSGGRPDMGAGGPGEAGA